MYSILSPLDFGNDDLNILTLPLPRMECNMGLLAIQRNPFITHVVFSARVYYHREENEIRISSKYYKMAVVICSEIGQIVFIVSTSEIKGVANKHCFAHVQVDICMQVLKKLPEKQIKSKLYLSYSSCFKCSFS